MRAAASGAKCKIHFLDIPFNELFKRLEERNCGPADKVTIIPPSKMSEYLVRFQAPDDAEMALNSL